jgi:hypothetical protein
LRFDQRKDHGNEWDDKAIGLDRVEEEIKDEELSPAEIGQLTKEQFERHSCADERLMSCGSCGVLSAGMTTHTRNLICKGASKFSSS